MAKVHPSVPGQFTPLHPVNEPVVAVACRVTIVPVGKLGEHTGGHAPPGGVGGAEEV